MLIVSLPVTVLSAIDNFQNINRTGPHLRSLSSFLKNYSLTDSLGVSPFTMRCTPLNTSFFPFTGPRGGRLCHFYSYMALCPWPLLIGWITPGHGALIRISS